MKSIFALLALAALIVPRAVAADPAADAAPFITDAEEYAVFAAVLFARAPEIPDHLKSERERQLFLAEYRDRVRLEGVAGVRTLSQRTDRAKELTPRYAQGGPDQTMIDDYNRKNAKPYRIDPEMLFRVLPTARSVTLLTEEEERQIFAGDRGWEEFRRKFPLGSGIVSFSRVGFNEDSTKAIVHVGCQADYEMGVAYLVFLEKSPKSGNWIPAWTARTRIS